MCVYICRLFGKVGRLCVQPISIPRTFHLVFAFAKNYVDRLLIAVLLITLVLMSTVLIVDHLLLEDKNDLIIPLWMFDELDILRQDE